MPRVLVLLSTFNGAKYLPGLLRSILEQVGVDVSIVVRDDGSSDQTLDVLSWPEFRKIDLIRDHRHVGVPASYFELLRETRGRGDYVAFSDQDDVWYSGKLERAIAALDKRVEPSLYCSGLIVVDEELRAIGRSSPVRRRAAFGNALVENVALGPTIVLNAAAHRLVARDVPSFAVMHDAWCYLICAAFGTVVVDEWASVLYRQHGSNYIGFDDNKLARLTRLMGARRRTYLSAQRLQAQEFARLYPDAPLSPRERDVLIRFIASHQTLVDRMRWLVETGIFRQRRIDNWALHALLVSAQ